MALLFMDSFDHYLSPNDGRYKWTVFGGPLYPILQAGRTNLGCKIGTYLGSLSQTLSLTYNTLYAGVAYKALGTFGPSTIIEFSNCVSNSDSTIWLSHVGDGKIQTQGRQNLTVRTSSKSSFVMNTDVWYFIELRASSGAGSIQYEVRINNVSVLSGIFSFPIRAHPENYDYTLDRVTFSGPGGGFNALVDDIYIDDSQFQGDIQIFVIRPNAEGIYLEWDPIPGPSHYQMVDDLVPDGDSTIIQSDTIGERDMFEMEDVELTGKIVGIQSLILCQKESAGEALIAQMYADGAGHEITIPNEFSPSASSYAYYINVREKNVIGLDWTTEDINNLKFGVKRTV